MYEKNMRMVLLYDFYQVLLTEKQQSMMDLYYQQDFSLAEIAEALSVSRQAVYDHLKRTESTLEKYEAKMKLLEKYTQQQQLMENMEEKLVSFREQHLGDSDKDEILKIFDEIHRLLIRLKETSTQ